MLRALQFFMTNIMPFSFLIIFFVQWKIIRVLRSHTGLILYYGKQIEEMRKLVASIGAAKKPSVSNEDSGLYEVLND